MTLRSGEALGPEAQQDDDETRSGLGHTQTPSEAGALVAAGELCADLVQRFNALRDDLSRPATASSNPTAPHDLPPTIQVEKYLPTFSGQPYEDPIVFFDTMEAFIKTSRAPPAFHSAIVTSRLTKEAAEYQKPYETIAEDFSEMKERYLKEYGITTRFPELLKTLTNSRQKADENVDAFFRRQESLFKRIFPTFPEEALLKLILQQLIPDLRIGLGALRHQTISEARTAAVELEKACRSAKGKNKPPTTADKAPAPAAGKIPPKQGNANRVEEVKPKLAPPHM